MNIRKTLPLLLCAAALASAQTTTYSNPVRITNTPLPVNGEVRVTGNTPVVTPSGVPLQVKAFDTIPVAQQGPVTVTPNGGTMSVTPNGGAMPITPQGGSLNVVPAGGAMPVSGSVSLSGAPTVSLNPSANTVQLTRPVVFSRYWGFDDPAINIGSFYYQVKQFGLPAGSLIEITSISGSCQVITGSRLPGILLHYTAPDGVITGVASVPVTYVGSVTTDPHSINFDSYHFDLRGPIFAYPSTPVELRVARPDASSARVSCAATIQGRIY